MTFTVQELLKALHGEHKHVENTGSIYLFSEKERRLTDSDYDSDDSDPLNGTSRDSKKSIVWNICQVYFTLLGQEGMCAQSFGLYFIRKCSCRNSVEIHKSQFL